VGFICPSCTSRQLLHSRAARSQWLPRYAATSRPPQPPRTPSRAALSPLRNASIVSSPTSINAPASIPETNKALYAALEGLKTHAASYVNLSQLQLAIKGIETTDPVTRAAILSLNSDTSEAKKLAKLLLADPLGKEEDWEQSLEDGKTTSDPGQVEDNSNKAVLLRYVEDQDIPAVGQQVVSTILTNSRVLKRGNLEILVASLTTDGVSSEPLDAILVPALASSSGTWVTYPVHRAIVFAKDLQGVVDYGRLTAKATEVPPDVVKLFVSLPAAPEGVKQAPESSGVDISLANASLGKIRKDIANAMEYEHGWLRSGISAVSHWLTPQIPDLTSSGTLNPAVKALITSLLSSTRASILAEATAGLSQQTKQVVAPSTKSAITQAVDAWAEKAHIELRDNLDLAFSGRHWRKLKWWKLFWRVDDVGAITSDILERRWLTNAEKGIIYVAGRLEEAGFTDYSVLYTDTPSPELSEQETIPPKTGYGRLPMPLRTSDLKKRAKEGKDNGEVLPPLPAPWPQQIPLLRSEIAATSIPSLQGLSQLLVLQTFSTTALSGVLSALTYVSFSSFGVLEAGAIAALGVTYAIRRMQNKWESARETWASELREDGRKVLKDIEEHVRVIIEQEGKKDRVIEGEPQRNEAAQAVARVEQILSDMK